MSKQKIFKFNFPNIFDEQNFFVNSTNIDAFNGLTKNDSQNIFLYGPKKSGKTSLGYIWQNNNNAIIYNDYSFKEILTKKNHILIDNFEKLNQENIFHIINHCYLNKLKILIISNIEINNISFNFDDLSSRIKTFNYFQIKQPDDEMLLNILTKLLVEKQFIINTIDIFNYIIRRIDRSYESVNKTVAKLDVLSLEKKRQLTIPLIKEII
tara:strand:- start:134 stop:763 length:630 start_codon:yes stop_codon:yes gene_type:complete